MLKGIVFDLDGTLVDSLSVTFKAFNHGILNEGGRAHTVEEIMKHFGPGELEIFSKIVGQEKAENAYRACRNYLEENLHDTPLHEGVGELLENLKSHSIPIAIFTGRSWNTTEIILKHHRILDRFVTVVSNDHVTLPKPSAEGLHLALSRMKIAPSEALYIGDSDVDIIASKEAGSFGVAALWDSFAKKAILESHSPHYLALHPSEIFNIFNTYSS